jgi:hypothetical protein
MQHPQQRRGMLIALVGYMLAATLVPLIIALLAGIAIGLVRMAPTNGAAAGK